MTMFFISIFVLYGIFMLLLIYGWKGLATIDIGDYPELISIVVAARNESSRINQLLTSLAAQSDSNFEVIIVDDQSDDDTVLIVNDFIRNDKRFRILSNNGIGKKAALTTGIQNAAGSIIVTTDADCEAGPYWIRNMSIEFADQKVMMVFGGVRMKGSNSLFDQLQEQEFVSLIGSAAAATGLGRPVMCNGANLAFRRQAFFEVDGYQGNFEVASGDDEFLMRKIIARYYDSVRFSYNSQTVVTTCTNSTLKQFVHQRLRWAAKWRTHSDIATTAIALFVFVFQLSTLILIALTIAGSTQPAIAITLLSFKIILEYAFFSEVNRLLNVRLRLWTILVLQLLYPIYVCTIGILCNFMDFDWKGRAGKKSSGISVRTGADYVRR